MTALSCAGAWPVWMRTPGELEPVAARGHRAAVAVPVPPEVRDATVAELVIAARAGSQIAFTTLYQRFHRAVHAVALARVAIGDAGDVVQDVFADAWQKLPSVRELSRELVLNPNTIARVYTELEREGILCTRPGQGVYVARPRMELTKKARRDRLLTTLDRFLTEAVHLGFAANDVTEMVAERVGRFQWDLGDGKGERS